MDPAEKTHEEQRPTTRKCSYAPPELVEYGTVQEYTRGTGTKKDGGAQGAKG